MDYGAGLMRLLVTSVVLLGVVALGAPNPKIAEARKLFEDLELEKAARTLAAAQAVPGNDRAQTLEILELQGVVFGTMNREAKARDAFRELLTLKPDYVLPGEHPPRVRTPFYEAKEWVSTNTPLKYEADAAVGASVTALTLTVSRDTLRLVKKARFVVTGGADPRTQEVDVVNGAARLELEAPSVTWRLELLSGRGAVLLDLGPFTHRGSGPGPSPSAGTPASPALTPNVSVATDAPRGWLRPVSYGAMGAGALAVGIGVVLGVLSADARARVSGAPTNEAGLIVGLSQREAAALEARARDQAVAANVLFVAGGVLAAAGAVLFIVGAPSEPRARVSLIASPAGLVFSGVFQ